MNDRVSAENGIAAEAVDRKLRSEAVLRAEGVPILATLPAIETAAEALTRSKEEVALRTLCLLFVAARAEGLNDEVAEGVLNEYDPRPHLSPKERLRVRQVPHAARSGPIHLEARSGLDSALGIGLRAPTRQARSDLRRELRREHDDGEDNLSVHRGFRTSSDRRHSRSGRSDLQVSLGCSKRSHQRTAHTGSS